MRRLIVLLVDNSDIIVPIVLTVGGIVARFLATRNAQHYREAGTELAVIIEQYGPQLKALVERRRGGLSDPVSDKIKEMARIADPAKSNPPTSLEEKVINAVAGDPGEQPAAAGVHK